jgi:DNA-binding ferritin-like protein (Dps family)
MTINGVELEKIDFTDADLIERIDLAKKDYDKKVEEIEKNKENLSPAEGIRQGCKIIKEFLDYVFGDGTSEKAFGNKNILGDCIKAFEDIMEERNKQLQEISDIVNKYSPDRLKR